jgi:hypothetical protein
VHERLVTITKGIRRLRLGVDACPSPLREEGPTKDSPVTSPTWTVNLSKAKENWVCVNSEAATGRHIVVVSLLRWSRPRR